MAHSLVGLSDSKFDFELVKKEIDHDFFDNPGTSPIDETKSSNLMTEKEKKEEDPREESSSSSAHGEENQKLDLCQNLPNNDHHLNSGEDTGDNAVSSLNIPEHRSPSTKRLSPAPTSLIFSKDAINNSSNDDETPVNCPFNNFGTGVSHQNIFCTGELLECLPNTEENCLSNFRGHDGEQQPGSFTYYQLMSQCASSKDHHQRSSNSSSALQQHHHRLFDLSDSSSDDLDSQSESSEIASLDTDDEEFVNMLEKYYDSIDLGDSDCSDITEVSPLSSLAPSPLPLFNGGGRIINDEAGVLESNEILLEGGNQEEAQSTQPVSMRSNSMFQKRCPAEAKPLPPLIIHTMEEIAAPTSEEPNTPLAIAISSLDSAAINRMKSSASSSLLMTVGQTENNKQEQMNNCFDPIKPTSEDFSSSESEERIRQSMSFTSSSRMSSGILSSSSSSQNEWSVGTSSKSKQMKNYTFTPDQMRRIDRENSILLRKILDTNKSHSHGHGNHHWLHVKGTIHHHRSSHYHHQSHKSSSAILRQRQQKRIDHENSILVRRLKSVKPSKEIVDAGFRPNGDNLKFNM